MRTLASLAAALLLAGCGSVTMTDSGSTPAGGPGGDETVLGTETASPAPGRSTSSDRTAQGGAEVDAVPSFEFAAAGDLGATDRTAAGLAALDASAADFFLALGDLDYDQTASDEAWCDFVRDRLPNKGAEFPFQLLAGNHEADGGPDGRVMRHAACLPDRLGVDGTYAAQYAFDYPAGAPLARFVLVSPRLTVDGHTYDYSAGTDDRAWLVEQLRDARRRGLWTVVGMHYPCLSIGAGHPECSSGRAVHNLVLDEGADLLVVGHNHVYERSKQLALSAECVRVRKRYDAGCVADAGGDDAYARDRGTVQVTAGRFGGRPMGVNRDDPDRRWFVKARSRTTGFLAVQVTAERLDARYVATSGDVRDSFVIE